jgi:hypothetical protein
MNLRAWVHGGIGGVALVLAAVTILGAEGNRIAAAQLDSQRTEAARLQRIAGLNDGLVKLLVKAAAEGNDAELRALLAANGVTFQLGAAPVAAVTP